MWYNRALCKNYPSEVFFPDIPDELAEDEMQMDDGTIWEKYGDTSAFYDKARLVCNRCPVKEQCLEHALVEKERWGMWGGLTPIERRRIERKDRRDRLKQKRASVL